MAPADRSSGAKEMVARLAAEGRKFKVFMILVTQRPFKIDSDVLSQCNSQIIMRLTNPADQNAVATAAEALSQDLLEDLPGLNVGEAVLVGELTRSPVMVKIGGRVSAEGGSDVDVVQELEKARNTAEAEAEALRLASDVKGGFREAEA